MMPTGNELLMVFMLIAVTASVMTAIIIRPDWFGLENDNKKAANGGTRQRPEK
jgi:hypothetical protein